MSRLVILLLVSLGLAVAGCGKKGDPGAPQGADGKFPRTYPKQQP